MKWIGLTGGIASGKSTVAQELRAHGIPVIDADEIAKQVVAPGSSGLKSVVEEFGIEVLNESGALDRRKLGQIVFTHPECLKRLEAILHPLVRGEAHRRREQLKFQGEALAIYDIPLLFETRAEKDFDKIIVVSCTKEQQAERLRRRNSLSDGEIEERISSQLPLKTKEEGADFVIYNDRDKQHLKKEIDRLLVWLKEVCKN